MENEKDNCKCMKLIGHLEAVNWLMKPRKVKPSAGPLSTEDWTKDPHIWLHYVESADGLLPDDDVLRLVYQYWMYCIRNIFFYQEHVIRDTSSRYWSIHDPSRYFVMEMHCEKVMFTCQYPTLRLPTRLGNHSWRIITATKLFSDIYEKQFAASLEITLKKIEYRKSQLDRLIVSDQLLRVDRLEHLRRKTFFRCLERILSYQNNLQLVSFENLLCKRQEGVRLVEHLACFNAHSLKYLFLWRFVLPNENPILVNYSYITGSGLFIPRPVTKHSFIKSLGLLTNLRVLALEYAHLADGSGGALLALLTILKRPHFRLQLICRETMIPDHTNAADGAGGYDIPDYAWKRVSIACPDLYLMMVFHCIRDYDDVRRFITPSMPIREAHYENGMELNPKQRQDSDVSCFIRHMAFRYASTLVTLSIHQWRFAVFPLRRVFELMPFLVRFYYVGRVQDEVDLKRTLHPIACGVYHKLKHLTIQVQDEISTKPEGYWQRVIDSLNEEYAEIMALYDINFCLCLHKC